MSLSTRLILCLAVCLSLALTGAALAQVTTAKWYGIVRDPTSAVIPGAEVTITHQGTVAQRNTVTSDTGEFLFDGCDSNPLEVNLQAPSRNPQWPVSDQQYQRILRF